MLGERLDRVTAKSDAGLIKRSCHLIRMPFSAHKDGDFRGAVSRDNVGHLLRDELGFPVLVTLLKQPDMDAGVHRGLAAG